MPAFATTLVSGIYEGIPSEDVVGEVQRERRITAWVIDGASTLTRSPFSTFPDVTDSGWFAQRLSLFFAREFSARCFSADRLSAELFAIRQEYLEHGGDAAPGSAWPVAAATIVEVESEWNDATISMYQFADCFAATLELDREPPPLTSEALEPVRAHWKPCSGFDGLRLEALKTRRIEQQLNLRTNALTLNPSSAYNSRHSESRLRYPSLVLAGSDGLSRIWESYNLMTQRAALEMVASQGLAPLFKVLRDYEASGLAPVKDEKKQDDASAIRLLLTKG